MPRGKREKPPEGWFWGEYRRHPWWTASLVLLLVVGLGGVVAYRQYVYVGQPAQLQIVPPPAPHTAPVAPVQHVSSSHPPVRHHHHTAAPTPSAGQANIPGVPGYVPPTTSAPPTTRAPPTPTVTPTVTPDPTPSIAPDPTPDQEAPTSAPSDTGSPSASVAFPSPPF